MLSHRKLRVARRMYIVMPDPVDAEDDEAQGVGEQLGPEGREVTREVAQLRRCQLGNTDLEDQERHRDREDAVSEGLDPIRVEP